MQAPTIEDVRQAAERLSGVALRTPVLPSRFLNDRAGGKVLLKCESLQRTGSFKIRGAYNRIAALSEEERARGVVAASAGNHGQGVALGASLLGVKVTVFMPAGAPLPKVEATSSYGAEVVLEGAVYDDSYDAAMAFAQDRGAIMVHPFDHPDVIAGQATVALEILDQVPDAATIVVPVGGGGLIAGVAVAAKALRPEVRVVGVEPVGAMTLSTSLEAGHAVTLPRLSTLADGLAARRPGDLTLSIAADLVDEMVTVTDEEIAAGLLAVAERAKLVVEPAGAAGVAAVLEQRASLAYPAVVLLSGGNIDPLLLLRVIRSGMSAAGRYFSFRTRLADRPGQLHRLTAIIAEMEVNIVGIEHRREGARIQLGDVEVAIQVETRGPSHMQRLTDRLIHEGYAVEPL